MCAGYRFGFAGLDFIFDRKMRPYFLEANSYPGINAWCKLHNSQRLPRMLGEYLRRNGCKSLTVLISKSHFTNDEDFSALENGIDIDFHVCLTKDNEKSIKRNYRRLVDINGKDVFVNGILRRTPLFMYNPKGVFNVNSPKVMRITRNKWLSYLAVRNALLRSPTSFLVKSIEDVKRVVDNNPRLFRNGLILKPVMSERGRDIYVVKDPNRLDDVEIKKPYVLQRLVSIKKLGGKYWDLRVFVIGGKYAGSMIRVSDNPVTNISLGGIAKKTPREIENAIRKRAEKCVRVIEEFSGMI